MGIFDSVGRVLGIGGGSGYQAPTIDQAAFKDPNAEANKKKIGTFMDAFQQANQVYTPPQAQAISSGQMGLVNTLQNRVAGNAPSVAQNQLQAGQEANLEGVLAAAASQPGASYGSNARAVARTIATSNRQANMDAANLRAQEQSAAEASLGGLLGNMQQTQQTATLSGAQILQNYLNMGLSIDQAQFLAQQDLAKANAGIAAGNMDRLQRGDAAIIGAISAGGAALATGGAKK